jgi:hypothetical protein
VSGPAVPILAPDRDLPEGREVEAYVVGPTVILRRAVTGVVDAEGALHVQRGPWHEIYPAGYWATTQADATALLIAALMREQDRHRHEIALLDRRIRRLRKRGAP